VIFDNYPTNLITEDWWGMLPLLYAFWGAAPAEISQFILKSYQSLYPDHVFDWTMMVVIHQKKKTLRAYFVQNKCISQSSH